MKTKISSYTFLIASLLFISACKQDEKVTPVNETSTMTDADGNAYKTVHIGNQWWMAEDLKVTHYRNGYSIPVRNDSTEWVSDTTGACSDIVYQQNVIGKYYNWFAINNANVIAPDGWHIPSDEEWKTLEKQLGMSSSDVVKTGWRGTTEGDKLKIEAPQGWTAYDNVWATNESGFTALANGCRLFDGRLGDPGFYSTGFWWSSTISSDKEAWYRYLDYKNSNVFRSHVSFNYGMSIRCVKD